MVALLYAALRPSRLASLVLAALSVVWPFVNGPLEGPVLWSFSRQHGLTLGDLLAPAGIVAAAIIWARTRARVSEPLARS